MTMSSVSTCIGSILFLYITFSAHFLVLNIFQTLRILTLKNMINQEKYIKISVFFFSVASMLFMWS